MRIVEWGSILVQTITATLPLSVWAAVKAHQ
jgi:hypothetical protein